MPIDRKISCISAEDAKKTITISNQSAMNNRAQYPMYEREYLSACCEFVKKDCASDCLCREFLKEDATSDMCWVIKRDCSLEMFKQSFSQLWIGSNFQARFLENTAHQRIDRALFLFSEITPEKWGEICSIGNRNRRTIICSQPLCDEAIALRKIFDTGRIYDSKFLSQLFYDSLIPHDTNSAKAMRNVGYDPSKNGLDISSDLRAFLRFCKFSVSELRKLDDAPHTCWREPNFGENLVPHQALSRVVDKLFYVP